MIIRTLPGVFFLCSVCWPAIAVAQEAPLADENAQDEATGTSSASGDEIVVTARRRNESVQDAPLSVTVIGGQSLARADISNVAQLNSLVPGLLVQPVLNNSLSVTMRGLGSNPGGQSFDQSVAVFFDGVFSAHAREYVAGIFDLERIEAVKGTQTALLGKNTSLGAISFVSKKPGADFGYNLQASRELELGSTRLEAGVNLPLSDSLSLRASGLWSESAGWIRNTETGKDSPRNDILAGRLTAAWRPSAATDVTLVYEHQRFRSRGQAFEVALDLNGTAAARAATTGVPGFEAKFDQSTNASSPLAGEPRDRQIGHRAALTLNHDMVWATFTSLTGYTHYVSRRQNDTDFLPSDFSNRFEYESDDKISQEFRLASDPAKRFSYVVGLYGLKDVWRLDQLVDNRATWVVPGSYQGRYKQNVEAYSAFGQFQLHLTDRLTATVGGRYTREIKDATLSRETLRAGALTTGGFRPFAETDVTRKEGNFDGSVGVQYKTGLGLLYASWSQGSKSGGFQNAPTAVNGLLVGAEYEGETARTLEVGAKFDVLGRGRFNLAFFNTYVDGFQNTFSQNGVFIVQNLNIRSRGGEVDLLLPLADGIDFNAAATYAHVEDVDAKIRVPRSPRLSGVVGLNMRQNVGASWEMLANANIEFRSRALLAPAGSIVPESSGYAKLNMRLALGRPDDGLEFAVVGKNLTDERIASFGFPLPNIAGAAVLGSEMPRTIALQVSIRR
jgi:iron complex outermembrane receptor protein